MNIRNVAIIAHVDHGKTTLVDCLLRQAKTKLGKEFTDESHLIMDSNELEKERGITIFSKNASVNWVDHTGTSTKINIIDTPGHADFGGEVERVLTMADGCLLLIDAKEGPMPQTRFVLKQALKMRHKIIVVINKIDKPDARVNYVINKTFELFIELGADDATAEFPIVYASAKNGLAGLEPEMSDMKDITPVFDSILKNIPEAKVDPEAPLQMLVTTIAADTHKGRIAIGRILNGKIIAGQEIMHINREGVQKKVRLTSLMTFEGLGKVDVEEARAGDIVAVTGILDVNIGETIADVLDPRPLPLLKIEEPTVRMTFAVNSSPFAGREGEFKTSRQIEERVYKELETDMALRVASAATLRVNPSEPGGGLALRSARPEDSRREATNGWMVSGRGELHLAIFIERLRREGYEFQVSRPQVINKTVGGKKMTPYEQVFIEVPEEASGIVMQKMGTRHGQMLEMNIDNGIVMYEFLIATKDLFGYRSEFLTDTRGLGIINTIFLEYKEDKGDSLPRERGSLVAFESGVTTHYGLVNAQDRGTLFIGAATHVYKGQVIGQNSRPDDMRINVCKIKQQSNMRSKGEGVSAHADTPKTLTLEDALEYIDDTELVEVTPLNVRVRKKILDELEERRARAQGKT